MNVCMISYSVYDYDNRVHRYARSLISQGHTVVVIGLRRKGDLRVMDKDGVEVIGVQTRELNERGPIDYLNRLLHFYFRARREAIRVNRNRKIQVLHYHNMPDFGIFFTGSLKRQGSKILFDIHDLVPEMYAAKFGLGLDNWFVRMLERIEKRACAYADHVITVTELWRNMLIRRSVEPQKCTVILNSPDPKLFRSMPSGKPDGYFRILYHGALNEHFGVDVAVKAVNRVRKQCPQVLFDIVGDGRMKQELIRYTLENGLEPWIHFHEPVPREEIPGWISRAQLGIVPQRSDVFSDTALSSKLLEFILMKKPVVASNITSIRTYFTDQMIRFFPPGNDHEMAKAIIELIRHPELRTMLVENASKIWQTHGWSVYESRYFNILGVLCQDVYA